MGGGVGIKWHLKGFCLFSDVADALFTYRKHTQTKMLPVEKQNKMPECVAHVLSELFALSVSLLSGIPQNPT